MLLMKQRNMSCALPVLSIAVDVPYFLFYTLSAWVGGATQHSNILSLYDCGVDPALEVFLLASVNNLHLGSLDKAARLWQKWLGAPLRYSHVNPFLCICGVGVCGHMCLCFSSSFCASCSTQIFERLTDIASQLVYFQWSMYILWTLKVGPILVLAWMLVLDCCCFFFRKSHLEMSGARGDCDSRISIVFD